MKRFAGWFGIVVALALMGMWLVLLREGRVADVYTAPVALMFHLVAEGLTALVLLLSGVGLLLGAQVAPPGYRVGIGMLLYSLLEGAGYFAERGEWPFIVLFAVIAVVALFALRGAKLRA